MVYKKVTRTCPPRWLHIRETNFTRCRNRSCRGDGAPEARLPLPETVTLEGPPTRLAGEADTTSISVSTSNTIYIIIRKSSCRMNSKGQATTLEIARYSGSDRTPVNPSDLTDIEIANLKQLRGVNTNELHLRRDKHGLPLVPQPSAYKDDPLVKD